MSPPPRPTSLVVVRALRFLRGREAPVDSVTLAREVLSARTANEEAARRVLEAAFAGDARVVLGSRGWSCSEPRAAEPRPAPEVDEDRVLVVLEGRRPGRGAPFILLAVSAVRLQGGEVVAACGGETTADPGGDRLRRAFLDTIHGAPIVVHDPPGALAAIERWLGEPLAAISLRKLGRERVGLPAGHDLPALASRLGVRWRDTDDPLDAADTLDSCLASLRQSGESLGALHASTTPGAAPIDWSRLAFDRELLRRIPRVAGTYRFYDADDRLLYVGKAKDLNRRVGWYFRETRRRSARVQQLLEQIHRLEFEPVGSELEAILREAEQIRRDAPRQNVQRRHQAIGRAARLRSILILEPAESPSQLRAFLVREGRLVGRVALGPRGGGLRRIARLLDDYFFFAPDGPTPAAGPEIDVELVVRWLGRNRDRVVAFDPTSLRSAREVTERLRWFLERGSLVDAEGRPILGR